MPTVSESTPVTPTDVHPGYPGGSAKTSPHPSPRVHPSPGHEPVDYPDPSRPASMGNNRPSAFTVNLDGNLAVRPKSAAPYPEDDRPAPLNLNRPKSTAPYPEDDLHARGSGPQLSPHYHTGGRPPAGPHSDRPGSAFGIRTGPGGPPPPGPAGNIRPSQSMGNMVPPAGADPRGRVSVGPPSGYRQPSPGPAPSLSTAQPFPTSGGLPSNPAANRLAKQNPYAKPQPSPPFQPGSYGPGDYGQPSPLPAQPGGYGQRTSSIPPEQYGGYGRGGGGAAPSRVESMPLNPSGHPRPQAGPGPAGAPRPFPNRPDLTDQPGRTGSAPPSSQPRPQQQPSPAPSAQSVPAKKPPTGQGPATFEAMGIPKGKDESDCIVM